MDLGFAARQGSASVKGSRIQAELPLSHLPLPLSTSSGQSLDPRGGHASPGGQGRGCAGAAGIPG